MNGWINERQHMNNKYNKVMAALALAGVLSGQPQVRSAEPEARPGGDRQAQWRQRLQEWRAQGGFDPQQMRDRLGDRLKTMLRATDEDWAVIQPLVEDVVVKQGAALRGETGGMLGAMGMMLGRRAGTDARGDDPPPQRSPGSTAAQALREVVEAENASVADIKAKLADLREARKAAETALRESRDKLRAVLSHRQEAQLVLLGILD